MNVTHLFIIYVVPVGLRYSMVLGRAQTKHFSRHIYVSATGGWRQNDGNYKLVLFDSVAFNKSRYYSGAI